MFRFRGISLSRPPERGDEAAKCRAQKRGGQRQRENEQNDEQVFHTKCEVEGRLIVNSSAGFRRQRIEGEVQGEAANV